MSVPEPDDLDEMTALVAGPGMTFDQLGPESRIQVITLVNQCDLIRIVFDISKVLNDIEYDTDKIGDWFKNSRLWEGS